MKQAIVITAVLAAMPQLLAGTQVSSSGWIDAGQSYRSSADDETSAALLRSVRDGVVDVRQLELDLSRIRPAPVAALFAVLDQGAVPVPDSEGEAATFRLLPSQVDVVRKVLVAASLRDIRGHLESVAGEPGGRGERELGLWLLGEVGESRDLGLLVRLATPADESEVFARSTISGFEASLEMILRRQATGVWLAFDLFGESPAALRAPIVKTIERFDAGESLLALSRLLGRAPEMDALIMVSITRCGSRTNPPVDPQIQSAVRAYLDGSDPRLALLAITAAGKLEDYDSVPYLIRLTEDGDANQRRCAYVALRDITGLTLRSEADLWGRWYRTETEWWERRAQACFAALTNGANADIAGAINEISLRRLRRHDLARELVACLDREEEELVALTCRALGHLGSRTVVFDLIDCLEPTGTDVSWAAWRALTAITGQELPPEARSWAAACE